MTVLNPPLVSIIIPCYNQGCFLGDTLQSVINQSYTNWECFVINDGSTDETENITNDYILKDNRISYIKTLNSGLSSTRNTGIKNSRGHFIQLLDADDLIEPDKLKTAIEISQKENHNNVVVYSSMRYFENGFPDQLKILGRDNFSAHTELKFTDSPLTQLDLIKAKNLCVISAPVYPRSLFNSVGFFDESLSSLEDWDFHIRCVIAGFKFHHHYAYKGLTLIRLHNNSMMRNQHVLDTNFYRVIVKHNLRKIEPSKKTPLLKKVITQITPPVFIRLIKKLVKFG